MNEEGAILSMIKALIFDFDGTIIDTETAWYIAFREAYMEYGVDLTRELYSQCIGTSLDGFNPYEYLITEKKLPIDQDSFRKSVDLRHTKLMELEKVRPGVLEYLEAAKDAGLRIGLASSSSMKWVGKYLDQLNIRHYFECIRTSDHVTNVKPDPELYIQTLACLQVKADEAIAIEDSLHGARAAASAGMHCVVTPNEITGFMEFDSVFHRANSLSEVDFVQLINHTFNDKS
ncbi:HAD family hydrolase [Paenibacillus macquariensis]|uniref:Hydrolase of the HAD superfamily n=2 Tax=Paenibacillus macquariensis TaxID=948756 RepID=A0ABY1JWQ6_9BACL|nr:HAD family hydrolase [Paenibacillus macquariensis]MEC0089432.1 HAD family hydrolase [Paenibacillus macquariensis]SIQ91452.1 putative hydrolase of the HAD superfamily [Paenibacillus macquariensis]